MRRLSFALVLLAATGATAWTQARPRARDLGIVPGVGSPGPLNAVTDVAGVTVGQVTISQGDRVRTGVTAIVPHGGNLFREKVPGAVFVGNAFGKLAGSTQVDELGTIETPIVLTNTLSVGAALDAVVRWTIAQPGNDTVRSVNALVGETNDGALNDIRGLHVTREHVAAAISAAKSGAVEEGAVGAGAGTIAFGWKGGVGSSSRVVKQGETSWTVGVLVQTNYGGRLTISGVPVWRELTPRPAGLLPSQHDALEDHEGPVGKRPSETDLRGLRDLRGVGSSVLNADGSSAFAPSGASARQDPLSDADGSCMIVVATDAPLDARDLKRLAARAVFALARTGSTYSNGSGDFAIAFSTNPTNRVTATNGPQPRTILPTDAVSGLFEAALDATEEAVYNSLLRATDTTSNGRTVRALPVDELRAVLKKYGR
jgi:D-aminopeptidase